MSHVTCHVSRITCQMSEKNYIFFLLKKKYIYYPLEKNGQSGGASRLSVCYELGLPRLVLTQCYLPQTLRESVYRERQLHDGMPERKKGMWSQGILFLTPNKAVFHNKQTQGLLNTFLYMFYIHSLSPGLFIIPKQQDIQNKT